MVWLLYAGAGVGLIGMSLDRLNYSLRMSLKKFIRLNEKTDETTDSYSIRFFR